MSIQYRPEIDGLRALAVIPVILFHAGFSWFSGGFVGVDVFFVVSGYLITSIIFGEIQTGRFSIINFYERRARRIIPALVAVCFACIPFAWLLLFPEQFKDFGQSLAAVALFSSNALFWSEAGYFATAAELKPLLHTWTLAVEEQFYIFFPLLLLALRKLSPKAVSIALFVIAAASLGLSQWLSSHYVSFNFFMLPSRAWELIAGALIAIALPGGVVIRRRFLSELAALAGLLMVFSSIFMFDETIPFPSVWALIPVVGTGIIIVFCHPDTLVGKLLTTRLAVGLGLISYSAYLWHQPVFAFARIHSLDALSTPYLLALSAFALAAAYLSWRFVEQPFRNKRRFSRTTVFVATGAASGLLIVFGLIAQFGQGLPSRIDARALETMSYQHDFSPYFADCHSTVSNFIEPEDSCVYNNEYQATVAVWGDSHATTISSQIGTELAKYHQGLREFTFEGCLPVVGYYKSGPPDRCAEHNRKALEYLTAHDEIQIVILHGRYTLQTQGLPFDNQQGGVEIHDEVYALPVGKGQSFIRDPKRIQAISRLYRETVEKLLAAGKQVVVVYPVPEVGWNVPDRLAREIQYGTQREEPLSTSYEVFQQRNRDAYQLLDSFPESEDLIRIYPEKLLCNTVLPNRCVAERNGIPHYADSDHIRGPIAVELAQRLTGKLEQAGWLTQPTK